MARCLYEAGATRALRLLFPRTFSAIIPLL
jgi:hypothetical protein